MKTIYLCADTERIFRDLNFGWLAEEDPDVNDDFQEMTFVENLDDDYAEEVWHRVAQSFQSRLDDMGVLVQYQREGWNNNRPGEGFIGFLTEPNGGEEVQNLARDMEDAFSQIVAGDQDVFWKTNREIIINRK